MSEKDKQLILLEIYARLGWQFGPQHWWPAEEPFEVIAGAILTQSTSWSNVEKGIANLKKANALSPRILRQKPVTELAKLIYSCGYHNVKANKLKAFADWFGFQYQDSLEKMAEAGLEQLRSDLLKVWGIGEETADSILLYACQKPVFVIDAYTRRIVDCLGFKPKRNRYCDFQRIFMDNLAPETQMFNEYHALLVTLGKEVCRKNKPRCQECCLAGMRNSTGGQCG